MMRIRGCLWHKGSNGLGVGPMWLRLLLPYRKTFDAAARKHDECYDTRGDGESRKAYDLCFFADMVSWCENWRQLMMAHVYFVAVRLFGWMFFRYDK